MLCCLFHDDFLYYLLYFSTADFLFYLIVMGVFFVKKVVLSCGTHASPAGPQVIFILAHYGTPRKRLNLSATR